MGLTSETVAVARPQDTMLEPFVTRAVAGDARACGDLLAAIQPMVLRYCRARLGRHQTGLTSAEDVAQDICVAVVSALPSYEVKGLSFRAFVYGIAGHKVADAYRAIRRNRMEPVAELPDVATTSGGPEQQVLEVELAEKVGHLVHQLNPRQREVLVLRLVLRFSAEETADVIGSTPGAVRVTQHRALTKLRELMGC